RPEHSSAPSFPTRRSSDLEDNRALAIEIGQRIGPAIRGLEDKMRGRITGPQFARGREGWARRERDQAGGGQHETFHRTSFASTRSEEHTSELQSQSNLVCR